MNILAILAHHDDEALLCGGTLLRFRELGHSLSICIATAVRYENTRPGFWDEAARRGRRL